MGRGVAGILTAAGLVAALPCTAHPVPCPDLPAPTVNVELSLSDPVLDTSRGVDELRRLGERPESAGFHLGLTASRIFHEVAVEIRFTENDDGVCGGLVAVDVALGVRDHTVYVAREVLSDACMRQAVQDHEMRHVEVTRSLMTAAAPALRGSLASGVREIGAQRATSGDALTRRIQQQVMDMLARDVARTEAELMRRQAAIDSPAEYSRVSKACGGALQRLLGPRRR